MDKKLNKNIIEIINKEGIIVETEINSSQLSEWKKKSERGKVCGIFGCDEKPTISCPNCWNWYCDKHGMIHFHIY